MGMRSMLRAVPFLIFGACLSPARAEPSRDSAARGAQAPSRVDPETGVPERERTVLLLDGGDAGWPGTQVLMEGMRSVLQASPGAPTALFLEHLDLFRIRTPGYRREVASWLARKYRGNRIDLIIALGEPALEAGVALRVLARADAPVLFLTDTESWRRRDHAPGVIPAFIDFDVERTVALARALFPETRRIALVTSLRPQSAVTVRGLSSLAGPDLVIDSLLGLSLDEARQRLGALPSDAVVFFDVLDRTRVGGALAPRDAIPLLSAASARPMFATPGTYFGHGIVGGSMIDYRRQAEEIGRAALAVLDGRQLDSTGIRLASTNELAVDWRQLRRWNVPAQRVPPGVRIEFRDGSAWERYSTQIIWLLLFVLVQTTLIAALLVQGRRRATARHTLRTLNQRLLHAQEEERTRIARELHDGVNQELALLAIGLDQLRLRPPDDRDGVVHAATELVERVQGLSAEVRGIAHELHPARLEQLGLVSAVRSLAVEVERRHAIAITVSVEERWPGQLTGDLALGVYRATQEALQNVVRHSGAKSATVSLTTGRSTLTLTVADSGRGMTPTRPGEGIGLAGMRERAEGLGGTLEVRSAPGRGTRIVMHIPYGDSAPRVSEPTAVSSDR
jgi:signal transduction histidine kinase